MKINLYSLKLHIFETINRKYIHYEITTTMMNFTLFASRGKAQAHLKLLWKFFTKKFHFIGFEFLKIAFDHISIRP